MGRAWRGTRQHVSGKRVRVRRSSAPPILAIFLLLFAVVPAIAQQAVRVGIYDNPPKVSIDRTGTVSGLYPELLEEIASEEGWALEYVPGSWTESMERLDRGEIDLMVDVAYTVPRQTLYAFNDETVLVNWGTVYTRAGLKLLSLPELEGLRVAVMRGSTHTDDPGGIRDLVERFAIRCTFVVLDNYTDVFRALAAGDADAGVVNRVFGLTFEAEYGVERTPIVFNPIELRFALPPEGPLTPMLIERIDFRLAELKADPDSVYYRTIEENLLATAGRKTVFRWPAWVVPGLASAGALIVVLVTAFLLVRREARRRAIAEAAHRRSEERFELAMRGATDGLWDWNLATGAVYYSPRWAAMLGYRSDEIEPTIDAFRRFLHPEDRERVVDGEARFLSGERDRYQEEFRMRHREGSYISVLSRALLVRDEEGTPIRVVGTHVDISERKQAEEALREREAYLRTIIDHMPVDFFAIDRDLTYSMQSPISVETIGDAIGRRADEIDVPESLRKAWIEEIHRVFEGEMIRGEYDVPTQAGDVRTYLSDMAPVDVDGEIIAAIGTSVDITERKRASLELQRAKEQAEAADRLKSAFLATMSHELRTPLNSIIGFTGILLQELAGPLNAEQVKQLGMVQTSARHLLDLINDVLDISKIEAGQLQMASESFDLMELIAEVADAARPMADPKGLELRVDLPPQGCVIRSDRRRVGQIVTNLLSNAVKFTETGSVQVSCTEDGESIQISVEDTGIGIGAEDLKKLFAPFQQIDSGLTRKYEGTGLGLSICKRLCEALGGTIDVESEPGHGSRFTVRIPKGG